MATWAGKSVIEVSVAMFPFGLHGHLSLRPLHIALALSMPRCVRAFLLLIDQDEISLNC